MSAIHANDSTFQSEVLESQQPVLVDFWAPWCGPCRALSPVVDEIAQEYDGKLKVVKVDVGEATETAAKYGVTSIPNLMVIDGGDVKQQLPGFRQKAALVELLDPYVN